MRLPGIATRNTTAPRASPPVWFGKRWSKSGLVRSRRRDSKSVASESAGPRVESKEPVRIKERSGGGDCRWHNMMW